MRISTYFSYLHFLKHNLSCPQNLPLKVTNVLTTISFTTAHFYMNIYILELRQPTYLHSGMSVCMQIFTISHQQWCDIENFLNRIKCNTFKTKRTLRLICLSSTQLGRKWFVQHRFEQNLHFFHRKFSFNCLHSSLRYNSFVES